MKLYLLIFLALTASCRFESARPVDPEAKSTREKTTDQRSDEQVVTGRVFRVNDGDTIQITADDGTEYKVRLHAIDAPELKQQFGETSRRELERLVRRQTVNVHFRSRDRYGRIIGRVMLGETNVNLHQIANGAAWHFKRYQNEQSPTEREAYAAAESTAKAEKRGLWMTGNPQPPWDWRDANQER